MSTHPDTARAPRSLFGALLDARDRHGRGKAILEDQERQPITYGRLVLGSLVLGRKLAGLTGEREPVGVLLPNARIAAVAFFALNAFGRVPAFLDGQARPETLEAACEAAGIGTILVSRRFVEQEKLGDAVAALGKKRRILWLEDVRATLTSLDKMRGIVDSRTARRQHAKARVKADDKALIAFGFDGQGGPRAVGLSNVELLARAGRLQASAAAAFRPEDVVFDPLPPVHPLSLNLGFVTALLHGMKLVLYPNPLHKRQIPKLVEGTHATVLIASDAYLQGYARAAGEGDLASLRCVIAGAEGVADETRRLWSRHGVTILALNDACDMQPVLPAGSP